MMKTEKIARLAAYAVGGLMIAVLGCQSMPSVTRSGQVKDIVVREHLSTAEVTAKPGDEIRWINKRQAPIRVVFLDPVSDRMSCRDNFGNWLGGGSQTAELGPNETASACFKDAGMVRYTVRMESASPAGERNVPGIIRIGEDSGSVSPRMPDDPVARTR